MGSLFSAIDIARSGLFVSRVQMDVAAHSIANVNTEGFSRQRVELDTFSPVKYPHGLMGRGVNVTNVRRVRDEFLDRVYRKQVQGLDNAEVKSQYYTLLEDAFLEPTEMGLGTRLNTFFDALNDFANNVSEYPVREAAVAEAEAIASTFTDLADRINLLRTNANEEVRNIIPEVNSLLKVLAETNMQIRDAELDDSVANDIRDQRDQALDQLAKLVNINYTERADGQITVRIGPDVVVDERGARELEAVLNPSLDPERNDLLEVRFADTGALVSLQNGELQAAIEMRDEILTKYDARIDTLVRGMIEGLNRIHTQGNGIVNLRGLVTSTNPASDATADLTSAGLPFSMSVPGSFDIVLYDASGMQVAGSPFNIAINPGDSLTDLVNTINGTVGDPNFTAALNPDNTTSFESVAGYTYAFANDSARALTALGVNTLFTGHDARTIAVNPALKADPGLLSSAYDLDVNAKGDNRAALDLAELRNGLILDNGSSSINDHYESTLAQLGVDTRSNETVHKTEIAFTQDFNQRRQEVSGVSLDEEVTLMVQYQRAFEAASRVVTTVERMLDALMGMVQ